MSESGGKFAQAGAVLSAGLASLCCILPLGLGALGLSGTVIAAFFEPLRPYFLAISAALLGLGFYFSFRSPREGNACAPDFRRLSKFKKPALWVSTVAVLGLALFPSIAGLASGDAEKLSPGVASEVVVLSVADMTCEACAAKIRSELLDVPGVIDAAVSYEKEVAEVRVREERAPEPRLLVEAVEKAGYGARVKGR